MPLHYALQMYTNVLTSPQAHVHSGDKIQKNQITQCTRVPINMDEWSALLLSQSNKPPLMMDQSVFDYCMRYCGYCLQFVLKLMTFVGQFPKYVEFKRLHFCINTCNQGFILSLMCFLASRGRLLFFRSSAPLKTRKVAKSFA